MGLCTGQLTGGNVAWSPGRRHEAAHPGCHRSLSDYRLLHRGAAAWAAVGTAAGGAPLQTSAHALAAACEMIVSVAWTITSIASSHLQAVSSRDASTTATAIAVAVACMHAATVSATVSQYLERGANKAAKSRSEYALHRLHESEAGWESSASAWSRQADPTMVSS